jgi:hypothetical protein
MKPKLLSGIGALFAALLIVGAIFVPAVSAAQENACPANEGDANPDGQIFSAQKTLRITPETPGMFKEELVAYAERMVADELGRDHYCWWQWSAAQNREDVWMGDDSTLKNFWNPVQFEDSTSNLLIYSPDSDIIGNEDTVTVSLGAEYRGIGCSISKDFVLYQDRIRLKPGECRVGSAGKFAVDWIGSYEGTQSICGICEERRQDCAGLAVLWTYSLTASQF